MKRRKGSLVVVITFGALLAIVVVGMLSLASSLYTVSRDSAKTYSRLQSYRAATELACYQYVTDLESVVVTKDLNADWVSVSGQAVYTQALEAIVDSIGRTEDTSIWKVSEIKTALSAANISDPSVLTSLFAEFEGARQSFQLKVIEPLKLDWSNELSWRRRTDAYAALEPVRIEVTLDVRGEHLFEQFDVNGLFLDVKASKQGAADGRHTVVTLVLVEGEEGVRITRASE